MLEEYLEVGHIGLYLLDFEIIIIITVIWFECAVGGVHTPPTAHSNRFQLFHDSSRQQYGVTVTRYCSYSCFVLLKMGDSETRNM